MAQRFTRFKSNYMLRSRHQTTNLGTVLERDWVTTNGLSILRFGPGRRAWYNSGNFVFTTSNVPTYHKKHKLSTETKEWTWDDCKTSDGTVNKVEPLFCSNDIRSYAYYGSCMELVRATVDEIISDFPACLFSTDSKVLHNGERFLGYKLRNDFKIDLHHKTVTLDKYDNELRFMSNSWQKYCVKYLDEDVPYFDNITNFTIGDWEGDLACPMNDEGKKVVSILIGTEGGRSITIDGYSIGGEVIYVLPYNSQLLQSKIDALFDEDVELTFNEDKTQITTSYQSNLKCHKKVEDNNQNVIGYTLYNLRSTIKSQDDWDEINNDNDKSLNEKIKDLFDVYTNPQELKISADGIKINNWYSKDLCVYDKDNDIYYTLKSDISREAWAEINNRSDGSKFIIQPQQNYIDEYFASLKGFKGQLLRQDTKPLYFNLLKTPIEYNFRWYYPERAYIWPSTDYCIDIEGIPFMNFYEQLLDMAHKMDELWCDNLYRSMTHESIKNFDWTYSRNYYEGEEQDNIDGGERMQKIIRLFGRVFDDVKYYIDTIQLLPKTTYDKVKNGPEALLSDKVNAAGIEAFTTIGSNYDIDANITKDFLYSGCVEKDSSQNIAVTSNLGLWYNTNNSEDVYPDICDNEFMRRLALSYKRIMQSKGTQNAIDMVMGMFGFGRNALTPHPSDDYTITEEAYYTKNLIKDDQNVTEYVTSIDVQGIAATTMGDLAIEVNANKDVERIYENNDFSGVPLSIARLGKGSYIVPYYDSSYIYDGNVYFQSKGGWGRVIKTNDKDPSDNVFDYQETLSYLHVVPDIEGLLSLNTYKVRKNDIYYVSDLSTYTEYDEYPSTYVTHYFVLLNDYEPESFSSWANVLMTTDNETKELRPLTHSEFNNERSNAKVDLNWLYNNGELLLKNNSQNGRILNQCETGLIAYYYDPTAYDYKKVELNNVEDWDAINNNTNMTLDNKITSLFTINSSFTPSEDGVILEFGEYDNSISTEEYLSTYVNSVKHVMYLENILSTNVGNNPHVGYGYYDDGKMFLDYMEKPFKYSIDKKTFKNDNYREIAENIFNFDDIRNNYIEDKIQIMGTYRNSLGRLSNMYNDNDDINDVEQIWYINTKVLTIENRVQDNTRKDYNKYFMEVILPYIMQVIPSTTILKLKGFE